VAVTAKNGGTACPAETSQTQNCDVDCDGSHAAEWSVCRLGVRRKAFTVTQNKLNGGTDCAADLEEACTQPKVTGTVTVQSDSLPSNCDTSAEFTEETCANYKKAFVEGLCLTMQAGHSWILCVGDDVNFTGEITIGEGRRQLQNASSSSTSPLEAEEFLRDNRKRNLQSTLDISIAYEVWAEADSGQTAEESAEALQSAIPSLNTVTIQSNIASRATSNSVSLSISEVDTIAAPSVADAEGVVTSPSSSNSTSYVGKKADRTNYNVLSAIIVGTMLFWL